MKKYFKKYTIIMLSLCLLFLTACSTPQKKGEKNINSLISAIFTMDEKMLDNSTEEFDEYYENVLDVVSKVTAKDDTYVKNTVDEYIAHIQNGKRATLVFDYIKIEEEVEDSEYYKQFKMTSYIDCTYIEKDKACEVIMGTFGIDRNGKIVYFEMIF